MAVGEARKAISLICFIQTSLTLRESLIVLDPQQQRTAVGMAVLVSGSGVPYSQRRHGEKRGTKTVILLFTDGTRRHSSPAD